MDVQPQGGAQASDRHFVGPPYGDIRRNVVEGGQLMAASLVAAAKTDPGKRVISVHAILSRPAVFDVPLDFQVDVHRAGRQFSTIGVQATQKGKPISSSLVLLDVGAPDAIRHQAKVPEVPGPEACPFHDFGLLGREVRFVRGDCDPDPNRIGPPELHCWVRHREAPPELSLRQALLAQSTSHYTIAASMLPHAGYGEALAHVSLSTGVLTVSLAIHEDPPLTDWMLYTNPSIWAGRGLGQGQGQVFSRDGRLIASYTAQVMIRHFDEVASGTGLDSSRLM
jgi:acyl-CoA thioesterase